MARCHGGMRAWRRRAGALAMLLAIALPSGPTRARDDVPEEIAKRPNPVRELAPMRVRYWERQFKAKCARCHGLDGAGGGDEAASMAVPPTDFTDARYMATRSDGQLFYQILAGGGERCAMPAFGPGSEQSWSEDRIWELVLFVRRFAQRTSDSRPDPGRRGSSPASPTSTSGGAPGGSGG